MSLKYKFTVQYRDGSAYAQNDDDTSLTEAGRSSFYDVLNGINCPRYSEISSFALSDGTDTYEVFLGTGRFYKNHELLPTSPLKSQPATPRELIYYRHVAQHFVVPAIFKNPKSCNSNGDGSLSVVDSEGKYHFFGKNALVGQRNEGEDVYYDVTPHQEPTETEFIIGWKALNSVGTGVTQQITID